MQVFRCEMSRFMQLDWKFAKSYLAYLSEPNSKLTIVFLFFLVK